MALSGKITIPKLSGVVSQALANLGLRVRSGWRVYPFQLGAMVRADSSNGTILTHGLGEFAQSDYVIPCQAIDYGEGILFVPDTGRITQITSDPSAAVDDTITTSPTRSVTAGEYLLCIGADGATTPLVAPDYDGSDLTLYSDNVGNTATGLDYLGVGSAGQFQGWVSVGYVAVDLLITNGAGTPQVVIPFYPLGPEVVP